MRTRRNPWLLVIFLMVGALAGGIGGEFLSRFPYFGWMSFGGVNGYRELFSFSMHPVLDIRVLSFGFDCALRLNFGSIIGMALGTLLYIKI